MVRINGKDIEAAGQNLLAYLTDQEYRTDRIAIELNGDIVSRKDYDKVTLKDAIPWKSYTSSAGADSLRQSSHELIYHYKRSVSQWKKKIPWSLAATNSHRVSS